MFASLYIKTLALILTSGALTANIPAALFSSELKRLLTESLINTPGVLILSCLVTESIISLLIEIEAVKI